MCFAYYAAGTMNGKVIPQTPIAVDCWQLRKCSHVRLFFLSHMHTDHTSGLTSTWSHRPIYCSPLTAKLLRLKLQVNEKWIHALEVGEPHMLALDDIGKEKLTVTLMDGNHCPGAVMFFFEGYFGTILYTGDFRYTPSMLREPCLRNNTTIHVLYLDNTNCDPTRSIPSRQRACQQVKEIIRGHPNYAVVIGMYALGKESLLVQLALEFKTWVEVDVERLETLRLLELPDVFSTEPGSGRLRVVSQSKINAANLLAWNRQRPTIAILPTSRPVVSCHPNVHVVPYSDHSSYQELEDFVSALRPVSLVPIVGNCMPHFSSLLSSRRKRHEVRVPESVQQYMREKPHFQPCTFRMTHILQRALHPVPRGVVFESPGKKPRLDNGESDESVAVEADDGAAEVNSEIDGDSDCVLLDMSTDVSHSDDHPLCRNSNQVTSEDEITVESIPADNVDSLFDTTAPKSTSKNHDLISPPVENTNPRETTINTNNSPHSSCVEAPSTSAPSDTHLDFSSRSDINEREKMEQWLLNNFIIPKEELTGHCGVIEGLHKLYPLTPINTPKADVDPFEVAILKLKSK